MLTEAAAVWAFAHYNQRTLPDDERLTFQIGIHVLGLAPGERGIGYVNGKRKLFYRPVGKVARRDVGKRIRLNLYKLFLTIVQTIDRDQDERNQRDKDLTAPFPKAKE